jgi:hypothetical protein
MIAEKGTVNLGKYTLPNIEALLTNTDEVLLRDVAKKFQIVNPDKVKTGKGISPVSNFAKFPKIMVKKTVVNNG